MMARSKCAQNNFYDGLVEKCMPCYLRCSKPPVSCTAYCIKPAVGSNTSSSSVSENNNVWLILLFLLLCAVTTLMLLIQILRKRNCQPFLRKEGRHQEQGGDSGRERDLEASKETDEAHDRTMIRDELEQTYSDTLYNSSLPLPSTEEGTTILVTTKTARTYNHAHYCTQDKSLNVCRSISVA
ncbi:tumor necrosis factor receptor superfamily member 17 [Anguilla anguilla]|uniref:tumor necrosis factor receptor superfamily member 17 n=1 Tax=Anguilla anguilla TaxID=7936 RepID=UPI0015A8236F|nr:tumor necrosis factor receptor superfamily member 17 [Anguilla anguilla]